MLQERKVAEVNSDLIRCLQNIDINWKAGIEGLENLKAEIANSKLCEWAQQIDDATLRSIIGIPIYRDKNLKLTTNILASLGENFAQDNLIVPANNGMIVISDPFDIDLLELIAQKLGNTVDIRFSSFSKIKNCWENFLRQSKKNSKLETSQVTAPKDSDEIAPIDKFFENLLFEAIKSRASDVHLENMRDGMRVRMRIDGKLHVMKFLDNVISRAIIAKVKIGTNAKIDETRMPQDKRIRIKIHNKQYDVRVSFLPTIYGENIALRIFNQEENDFTLSNMGLFPEQLKILNVIIKAKSGLILLCGPTGCGKTTTLYTVLKEISSPTRKIITIEDPIEYRLDGINQIPVNNDIGLSFASILRSVLRQSPNVIMVGEIRDNETAELAIQASLTGHLVFSTLHCNTSAGAITRLLDFNISKYLIKSCLRGAISQKLVRKPCENCSVPRSPTSDEKKFLKNYEIKTPTIAETHGCHICSERGYKGRIAAFDFLVKKDLVADKVRLRCHDILENFVCSETFQTSIERLLLKQSVIFEDAKQVLLLQEN